MHRCNDIAHWVNWITDLTGFNHWWEVIKLELIRSAASILNFLAKKVYGSLSVSSVEPIIIWVKSLQAYLRQGTLSSCLHSMYEYDTDVYSHTRVARQGLPSCRSWAKPILNILALVASKYLMSSHSEKAILNLMTEGLRSSQYPSCRLNILNKEVPIIPVK